MTTLLFQTDSYLREFTATVTASDEEARTVVLDQTAFYPGGGGQPHDRGTLHGGSSVGRSRRSRSAAAISSTISAGRSRCRSRALRCAANSTGSAATA